MSEESTQPGSGYPRARATSSPATEPDADARWRLSAVRRVAASALPAKLRLALVCGYLPVVRVGDGAVWCGPEHVAAATGLSLRTCKSIPQELVALGVLVAYSDCERPAGQRRTAAYRLDLDALAAEPPRRTRPARRSDASAMGTASKPGVQDLHSCAQPTVQELHTYEVPRAFGSSANPALLAHDGTDALASWGAAPAPNRSIEEDLKKEEILLIPRASVREDETPPGDGYPPEEPAPAKAKPVDTAVQTVWEAFCRTADEFYERTTPTAQRPIPGDVRSKLRQRMEATRTARGSWPAAISAAIDMIGALHFSQECTFYQGKKDGKTYLGAGTIFKNEGWTDRLEMGERWARAGRERPQEKRTDGALVIRAEKAWEWIEANHPLYAVRPDDIIDRWKDQRGVAAFRAALNAVGGWTAWGNIPGPRRTAAKNTFIAAFTAAYAGATHED